MKSPGLTIVADDNAVDDNVDDHTATPAQAGVVISTGNRDDAVKRALAAAVRELAGVGDLLDALSLGRLWLPLPDDGAPVTDGSGVHLPTVKYLGGLFVPAYTSAARLLRSTRELAPGQRATVVPHAIVRAADLARRLPPGLGIALNPGDSESVPIYPAGVAHLAAERGTMAGRRVKVGPLPAAPGDLLTGIRAGLGGIRAAREAAAAWLYVDLTGEGMIISVTLDDPADAMARDTVIAAVQRAATTAARDIGWPIDVTFPGEGEPDLIDRWISASATPFYQRPPAPRPATA